MLTKVDTVSHHSSGHTARGGRGTPGRHRRPTRWSALSGRAAVAAGSTPAAAVLAALPLTPVPAPHVPPTPTTGTSIPATVTAPVVPVAMTRSTVLPARFDVPAAVTAAAPAALRASAMQNALGKIGARYRWGASGPNAFDCSGLVTWAYRSAGRTLPRSSQAMAHVGTPVSRSALQPGDLVFFYRGPSHVAIYVGNGKVVHASNPAHPVKLADLGSMPFNSARRV